MNEFYFDKFRPHSALNIKYFGVQTESGTVPMHYNCKLPVIANPTCDGSDEVPTRQRSILERINYFSLS